MLQVRVYWCIILIIPNIKNSYKNKYHIKGARFVITLAIYEMIQCEEFLMLGM